jgi:(p)ppGpp synthase/HD superfamily hydrolase
MNELIFRAREFAREAHKAQLRRYTGEPYFTHPEEVAGMVERAGLSENAIAAAFLHDIINDQGVEPELLFREFGPKVASMVVVLTDTPVGPGFNRERRKALDMDRLSKASVSVQGIRCADLISNTSTIVKYDPGFARIYLPEKRAILEVLTRAPAVLRDAAWACLRSAEDELLQAALSVKD